jgi:peroxiredoxin/outer membrane lipoprotein-sorting protein
VVRGCGVGLRACGELAAGFWRVGEFGQAGALPHWVVVILVRCRYHEGLRFIMMGRLIPSILFLLLVSQATAQVDEAAGKLLHAVAERYATLESFHFEAVEVTRTRSGNFERSTRNRVVTALDSHGRSRVEFDDGSTGGVTVFDGETTWVYFPHLKKYSKFSGKPMQGASELGKERGLDFAAVAQRYSGRYRGAGDSLVAAKLVRQEPIEVDGRSVDCQVVEAQYQPPQGVVDGQVTRTYWIDPGSKLILREQSLASMKPPNLDTAVEVRQVIEFHHAKVGPDLPAALFTFEPPEGAEQADSSSGAPGGAGLVGSAAPDFTLQDLAGRNVALKQLRGQVVVLDFWATWCGPCRIDMPRIEALHNELKDRGLRVFGVNGEDGKVARAYLDGNGYTFPTLSDPGMAVSRMYEVNAIPTAVVIDKQGKVGAYLQGSGSKERLVAAIRAAGLE